MSETTQEPLDSIDIDLTGVNIERPLLGKQTKLCVIGEVKLEKPEGRGRSLVIPLTLEEPATSTTGATINPGFVVIDRILIDPTGGLTSAMIAERLARLQCAAQGTKTPVGKFDAAALPGKRVLVTFDVRPDKNDPEALYQDVKRYSAPRS